MADNTTARIAPVCHSDRDKQGPEERPILLEKLVLDGHLCAAVNFAESMIPGIAASVVGLWDSCKLCGTPNLLWGGDEAVEFDEM